jgi:hypothetical protein
MPRKAYKIIDGGQYIPYHLLFYMIAHFCIIPNGELIYYYFPKGVKLAEELLALLPPNWIRHTELQPDFEYVVEQIKIDCFEDWVWPVMYHYLRVLFEPYMAHSIKKGNRFYISRNRATKRQIVNEDEVMNILEPLGFQKIFMEDISVAEQIRLFSEAEIIITPHGSALAFSVFSSEDTKIIEIYDEPLTEKKHYSHIAWALGFEFRRFRDVIREGGEKGFLRVNCARLGEKIESYFR